MISIILDIFVVISGGVLLWIGWRDRALYSRHRDKAYLLFVNILDGADPNKDLCRTEIENWVRAYQEE